MAKKSLQMLCDMDQILSLGLCDSQKRSQKRPQLNFYVSWSAEKVCTALHASEYITDKLSAVSILKLNNF